MAAGLNSLEVNQVGVSAGAFAASGGEGGGDGQSGLGVEPILTIDEQGADKDGNSVASLDRNGNSVGVAVGLIEGIAIDVGGPIIGVADGVDSVSPVVAADLQGQLAVFGSNPLVDILVSIFGHIQIHRAVHGQLIGVVLGAHGPAQNKLISSFGIGIIGQNECAGAPEIPGIRGLHNAIELAVDVQLHTPNVLDTEPDGLAGGHGDSAAGLGIILVKLDHLEGDHHGVDLGAGNVTLEGFATVSTGFDHVVQVVLFVAVVVLHVDVLMGASRLFGSSNSLNNINSHQTEATVVVALGGNQLVNTSGQIFVSQGGGSSGGDLGQAFNIGHNFLSVYVDQGNSGGIAAAGRGDHDGHISSASGGELQSALQVLGDLNSVNAALAFLIALSQRADNGKETVSESGASGDLGLVIGGTDVDIDQRIEGVLNSLSCSSLVREGGGILASAEIPQVDNDFVTSNQSSRHLSAGLLAIDVDNDQAAAEVGNIQDAVGSGHKLVVHIGVVVEGACQSHGHSVDDNGVLHSASNFLSTGFEGSGEVEGSALVNMGLFVVDFHSHSCACNHIDGDLAALFKDVIGLSVVINDKAHNSGFILIAEIDGQGAVFLSSPDVHNGNGDVLLIFLVIVRSVLCSVFANHQFLNLAETKCKRRGCDSGQHNQNDQHANKLFH